MFWNKLFAMSLNHCGENKPDEYYNLANNTRVKAKMSGQNIKYSTLKCFSISNAVRKMNIGFTQ